MKSRRTRVIPVVQIQDGRAVKSHQFNKRKYLGDPINTVRIFSEKCVDELFVVDISPNVTEIDFKLIEKIADEAFMPISYGGHIESEHHAHKLFSLGVEKMLVGWKGATSVRLVTAIAREYGSQAISVCVDVSEGLSFFNRIQNRHRIIWSPRSLQECISIAEESGAGEIVIQSVDRDGTQIGYDLELIGMAAKVCHVPLVALGGCSSIEDMQFAINAGADAVGAGAFFLIRKHDNSVLVSYPSEQQRDGGIIDSRINY